MKNIGISIDQDDVALVHLKEIKQFYNNREFSFHITVKYLNVRITFERKQQNFRSTTLFQQQYNYKYNIIYRILHEVRTR
jgi:hypothetical protein